MVDEQVLDYFDDNDLAEAENLPEGGRYIGYVSKVDTSEAEPGAFRKLNNPLKDGRTEVPQISVSVTAIGKVREGKFSSDVNYYRTSSLDFWIGKEDRIGRHSLARLIQSATGMLEEDVKATPIREAVKQLDKVYLTFDVKHRTFKGKDGSDLTAQDFVKVKTATAEEVAEVV